MPLPTNGSFPVLGYSRPGEAVQSKPKRAIIVRMSPETLKALQDFPNNPPMEFQFGENPKIYIGDECFNLNPAPETTPHDLYLRASSATKKNPPFKLHANIIGKLTVQRELVAAVGEKVRGSATEAIAQRARTNVMTEDPKALITETKRQKEAARQLQKKKKSEGLTGIGASSRSNGSSLLDKAKNKAVASAERMGTAKIPSNPLDRLSPDRAQDIRRRLIHFAAQAERSEDEVVRAIGGSNPSPQSRQVICHILDEVAEQVGKPGSKYRLKAKSWKEVRPYEWDKWSDSERTRICREARVKLSKLGVSESDPLWAHFVYRRPNNGNGFAASPSHPSQSSSAQTAGRRGTPEPKRPLMTSDYREKEKEKAGASRVKAKGEIMAKDESRSASRNGRESPSEMSRVASSSSSTSRKQPGSGFKAPNSKLSNDITRDTTPSRKTEMRPPSTTGRDSPSASSVRSDTQVGRVPRRNRERAGSVHDSDTERRRTGQVHQGSKLVQRTKVEDDYQDSDVERRRQQRHADQEREREKEREREWEREKEKEREREREKEREWEWEQEEKEKLREKERRQREREQDRERERRERERERAKESDKERERNGRERRDRDRVRVNGRDRDAEQEKPSRVKELRREREEGEASDAGSASASKRKARAVDDDDDYSPSKSSQKRRRTDQAPIGLPPKPKADPYPESRYERSYSRQSESAESKRIKREPSPIPSLSHRTSSSSHKRPRSPLPPAPNKRAAMSVPRDRDTDSRSGSLKPRKNYKQENSDMIYTDSSDSDTRSRHKEELPQSRTASTTQRRVADSIGKLPELPIHPTKLEPGSDRNTLTPLPSNGNGRIPSQNRISRPHERLASLQKEYSKKFYPYDEQWRNMDAQQRALKRMLKKFRSGVDSVSEDDDPLMESGDLERGVGKLRKMADELILLDKEIKTLKDICGARVLSD